MEIIIYQFRKIDGNAKGISMLKVSVIIATYNRRECLKKCLESLAGQECDGSFSGEIIVVDNNSSDTTKEVVEAYFPNFNNSSKKKPSLTLRYLFEPKQGKSYALNKGIDAADGEIVAFTDDDVVIDPKWLASIAKCFSEYDCDGVGGRVVPIYPDHTPQWIKNNPTKLAGIVVIADYGTDTKPYSSSMDPFIGSNYAFKKEVFNKCGSFREDLGPGLPVLLGEDVELVTRFVNQGKTLYYCGEAIVRHPVDLGRLNIKHISKWHMALGRFAAQNEMDANEQDFVTYFGIPRYLLIGAVKDSACLILSLFSRPRFYNRLRGLFRKVGMMREYRDHVQRGILVEKRYHG